MKKEKKTNNYLQNTTQKITDWAPSSDWIRVFRNGKQFPLQ